MTGFGALSRATFSARHKLVREVPKRQSAILCGTRLDAFGLFGPEPNDAGKYSSTLTIIPRVARQDFNMMSTQSSACAFMVKVCDYSNSSGVASDVAARVRVFPLAAQSGTASVAF